MTDPGSPTPPPSHPTAWGSDIGPPPSTPVTHATASTIAPSTPPRKRWLVVLIGVCLLILGFAIGGTSLFFTNTLPPLDAANDFTNEFLDGLSTVSVNPFGVDRDGDRATVKVTIRRDLLDDDRTFRLYLVHEDGEWRPCFPF